MKRETSTQLPLGVGRVSAPWWIFMGAAALFLASGLSAYYREQTSGFVVTGLRDLGPMGGATWGIYVAFVVYFVGVSFAGITIAALIRLFALERLRPVARMAEVLTVVALLLGTLAILADLGQPLRGIVNLFRYARPQSPFFGTFTLVISGYLFASLVYLYLDGRADAARLARTASRLQRLHRWWASGYHDTPEERQRHQTATFWLAIAIIPLLVVAHSTLGFVFGLQVGRPGWYSALQAPAFVVLAGVSGVGHLLVLAAIVRRAFHQEARLPAETFELLGKFMLALLVAYAYFSVVEILTAGYTGSVHDRRVTDAILTGEYAWVYWSAVALLGVPLIALFIEAVRRRWSVPVLVASGIAVNVAAVGKRFLVVVPSQTKGMLLPYRPGSYWPSVSEIQVVVGLLALGAFLIALFMKAFPIIELEEEDK